MLVDFDCCSVVDNTVVSGLIFKLLLFPLPQYFSEPYLLAFLLTFDYISGTKC